MHWFSVSNVSLTTLEVLHLLSTLKMSYTSLFAINYSTFPYHSLSLTPVPTSKVHAVLLSSATTFWMVLFPLHSSLHHANLCQHTANLNLYAMSPVILEPNVWYNWTDEYWVTDEERKKQCGHEGLISAVFRNQDGKKEQLNSHYWWTGNHMNS